MTRTHRVLTRGRDAGPSWGGVALPAVVLGLVVLGGALVATNGSSSASSTVPAMLGDNRPGTTDEAAAPSGYGAGEPPLSVPAEQLVTPPAGARWVPFESGTVLPEGSPAGPTRVTGPAHHGFAHSPQGALLALAQISTRSLATRDEGWRMVTEAQVLPGPGREAYLRRRGAVSQTAIDAGPKSFGLPAGFRFVTYSPSVAVVQLVHRFPADGGLLQVSTVTVRWADGPLGPDWLLELQPDGAQPAAQHLVPDLLGFVVWGPA